MPRFVILEHNHPTLHWDFLIEKGDVLRAWRLAEPPTPGRTIVAQANFDHRLQYLDYEGEVSGQRGRVVAWDRGVYEVCEETEVRMALRLQGTRSRGLFVLEKQGAEAWLLHAPLDET